ncbi:MAG TPA: hypothetical protein VEJ68_01450 [Candidatus Bathyarchaeia archaeon]|nr:hypothetical protein [Candidatus Bathyarchaeia archaeon]
MITKEELDEVLHFVAKRWVDMSREPNHKAFANMPTNFWMNSMGGGAGEGKWVTTLMYTEDAEKAEAFKEVLLRWQSVHNAKERSPDLIQIGKK